MAVPSSVKARPPRAMDDLEERVAAVERALTEGEGDLTALAEGAATADRVAALESTVEDLQEDVAEVEAATQALRGYVGTVRSVNESVEEQADAALAAVESLEARVDDSADESATSHADAAPDRQPSEQKHMQRPATDAGTAPTEQSNGRASGRVCRSCGQRTAGERAAADGGYSDAWGREGDSAPASDVAASRPPEQQRAADSGPLDEFDPADGSHRVRIESDGGSADRLPGSKRDETGGESGAAGGLIARVRERL